jgi:hypothetical protein
MPSTGSDNIPDSSYQESHQAKAARDANTITSWRVLAIGALSANGLILLVVLIMQVMAATKPTAPFVTSGNGEINSLEYMAGNKRSPALITDFVRRSMIGIFTWRSTLPEDGNPPDPGVEFGKGKISTTSYRYTFALTTQFGDVFRPKLAEITSQITNGGQVEVVYIPANITQPVEVSPGVWTVDVVGAIFQAGSGSSGKSIPINRKITVRAVPPLTLSEVALSYKQPGLANAIARIRAPGLAIDNMVPLNSK